MIQLRTVDITLRQLRTTKHQFAYFTISSYVEVLVYNIGDDMGQCDTDIVAGSIGADIPERSKDGTFGGAVCID